MTDSSHTALRRRVEALRRSSSSPAKTPTLASPDWHADLSAASQAIKPMIFDAATLRHRADLLRALKSDPYQAQIWRDYLAVLNTDRKEYIRQNPQHTTHHIRMFHTLQTLYETATTVVPMSASNRHSPIYTRLWLDLAALRAEHDPDDASVIFKRLKNHRIGQTLSLFWNAWADLELRLKNHERAARFRREAVAQSDSGELARESGAYVDGFSSQRHCRSQAPLRPPRRVLDPPRNLQSNIDNHGIQRSPNDARVPATGRVTGFRSHGTRDLTGTFSLTGHTPVPQPSPRRTLQTPSSCAAPHMSYRKGTSHAPDKQPRNADSPEILRNQYGMERGALSPKALLTPENRASVQSGQDESGAEMFAESSRLPHGEGNGGKIERTEHPRSSLRESNRSLSVLNDLGAPASLQAVATAGQTKVGVRRDAPRDPKHVSSGFHRRVWEGERVLESGGNRVQVCALDASCPDTGEPLLYDHRFSRHHSQASGVRERGDEETHECLRESGGSDRSASPLEGGKSHWSNSRFNQTKQSRIRDEYREKSCLSPRMLLSGATHTSPCHAKHDSLENSASKKEDGNKSDDGRTKLLRFLYGIQSDRIVTVNNRPYLILEMVGKGGSSKVFKVLSQDMKILAMKRVKVPLLSHFRTAIDSYANEIALLRKLSGSPSIIELFDAEVLYNCGTIQMIMEYGDTDLAKLLFRRKNRKINDNFIRMYWQQMLEAVHTIHEARIIHGDLKPANFVVVGGSLKLIDFGIAKAIVADDTTKVLRDSQVGTPNYMSPEALMCEEADSEDESACEENAYKEGSQMTRARRYKVGRGSDIWSLGCILYQMVHGRTPFAHIKNTLQKLSCIQDPTYKISFGRVVNSTVVQVLQGCLQRDPERRMSIPELLRHKFICPEKNEGTGQKENVSRDMHMESANSRAIFNSVVDILRRRGCEGIIISGQAVPLSQGEMAFERIVDDAVRNSIGILPGSGITTSTATDVKMSARKDQNGQPWKVSTTPTASVVTPCFGSGALGTQVYQR